MVKKILLVLLAAFIVIQFFRIDKTNPESKPSEDFLSVAQAPENVAVLVKNSCYDCHSHHTEYPWYTNIAPVSWWIKNHINHAREHLNFSEWGSYEEDKKEHKLEECADEVREGHMPLSSYLWLHSGARMTEEERNMLVEWFSK